MRHFRAQRDPFAPNKDLCGKHINIIFRYFLMAPSTVQNLKNKSSKQTRIISIRHFQAKNDLFSQKFFFQKPINKSCSFHWFLSTFKNPKSDANPLLKYWRLKKTEISLAGSVLDIDWQANFFKICSFRRTFLYLLVTRKLPMQTLQKLHLSNMLYIEQVTCHLMMLLLSSRAC